MINVYSVFDEKVKAFGPIFEGKTDGAVIRSCTDTANDATLQFGKHPGDFVLYRIATFDDEKGQFVNITPPERLVSFSSLVTKK